jgi:uncharacterized membrane protein
VNVAATVQVADQASGAGSAGDEVFALATALLAQPVETISSALGVTVEAVATVPAKTYPATVEITNPNAPEVVAANQGDDDGDGMVVIIAIIAGVVGGLIVVVIIYLVFCRKPKKSHKEPVAAVAVVNSTVSASSASSAAHEMQGTGGQKTDPVEVGKV